MSLLQQQTTRPRPPSNERYKVAFALEYWHILDSAESHPPLATFHIDCPDAEAMAKSLVSWLNSGPDFPFKEGQRIRHKHGRQEGIVVGKLVRKSGDSYESYLAVEEWEPV